MASLHLHVDIQGPFKEMIEISTPPTSRTPFLLNGDDMLRPYFILLTLDYLGISN
jgi:hypothetical protein